MRTLKKLLAAGLSFSILAFPPLLPNPAFATGEAPAALVTEGGTETLNVKITGMTYAGCASQLHKDLAKKEGILANEVKYPGNVAAIKFDPAKVSAAEILNLIEKAGFKAKVIAGNAKASTQSPKGCCAKNQPSAL